MKRRREIIEKEMEETKELEEEIENLENSWFKTSGDKDKIEMLKLYLQKKTEIINLLK